MIRALRLYTPLLASLAVGAAVALALTLTGRDAAWRAVIGWDATCAVFLILAAARATRVRDIDAIRRRSQALDQGGRWILPLSILAAGFALGAVALEGAGGQGRPSAAMTGLTILTLALSWSFVQALFAFHYAHEFYAPNDKGHDRRGLLFPGETTPDYWDFIHFAIVIGVAAQTADIQITSRTQRHVATLHSLTAFVFNTVIVAMAVNLAVSLF
ncbi:DUF1345 domain-containing protein [Brevundimonas sp.]|uniref:DUF1345 domain-containing protein n=1 Tax=Brevundimonas sp. TaxID=1871086 RepID=UPI002FDA326A